MSAKKERELFAANLDGHVEAESRILREYRALAEKVKDGTISFLIDLILTEEEQHHFMLRTMARWLREPSGNRGLHGLESAGRDELLRHTRRLREHERETMNACRNYKSQVPLEDPDLFAALLDAMILDSENHEKLLLAVESLTKA